MSPSDLVCGSLGPFPNGCTRVVSRGRSFNCRLMGIGFCPLRCVPGDERLCVYSVAFSLGCSIAGATVSSCSMTGRSRCLCRLSRSCVQSIVSGGRVLGSVIPGVGRLMEGRDCIVGGAVPACGVDSAVKVRFPRCLVVAGRTLGSGFRVLTS